MKKKIIALALVLMLTLAMMMPVFAAEPRACSHNWVDSGSMVETGCSQKDGSEHWVNYYVPQICTRCAGSGVRYGSYSQAHSGYPCSRCNYPLSK